MKQRAARVYVKEIKDHILAFIVWSACIALYLLAGMSKYQGYAESGESLQDIFNSLPQGFSALFGVNAVNVQTAGGFFALAAVYMSLILGIHALLLGSQIIGREETDKTAEFLFTKPISKSRAWLAKIAAGLTIITALNIATAVSSVLFVAAFNNGFSATGDILLQMPGIFFLQLIFFVFGAFFASVLHKPKHAGQITGGILLITFVMQTMANLSDQYDFIRYFTPFAYFDPKTIYIDASYNAMYIFATIALLAILIVWARTAYRKRDLDI